MKPSPGIIPQQQQIEALHANAPAAASSVAASDMVDSGQVADEQAVEKSIVQKLIAALKSLST